MMRLSPSFWYTEVELRVAHTRQERGTVADQIEYQIQVEGWIGERWAHWFEDTVLCAGCTPDGTPVTTLSGAFDQAALRGTLIKLWDLNLTLLRVTRVESRGENSNGEYHDIL
jgi:hypothetical protein